MENEEITRSNEWNLCPTCSRPFKFHSLMEMTTRPNLLICPEVLPEEKKEEDCYCTGKEMSTSNSLSITCPNH